MKKILMMALSVMIFTGAMAQQKTNEASLKAKTKQETKLTKQSAESSQSANSEVTLNAQDLKSKAKEKKNVAKQKLEATQGAIDKKTTNSDASSSSKLGIGGTVSGNTHGADVSTAAQSDVTTGTKGAVVSKVASVNSQANTAVKNVKADVKANVKANADVKVKTDVNIKPKAINTKVKAATGIKL